MLLAGLSGCVAPDRGAPGQYGAANPFGQATQVKKPTNYQAPYGEPIAVSNSPRAAMSPAAMQANYVAGNGPKPGADLVQAGYLSPEGCKNCAKPQPQFEPNVPQFYPGKGTTKSGITPVPAVGPPGAVAAVGALPAYGPPPQTNMRTSIRFGDPVGMRVTWYGPNGWNDVPLETPARYNFLQGGVYRLKLSSIANRVERVYYPTLDVLPASPKTITYLAHSSVPITFTDEDFEQVESGNFLVKVVYLPDPQYQDLATVVGPNELVSTRLEPGVDPIVEAQKRGTILMIIRMGNIDLQAPNTPAMDAPNPYMMQGMPRVAAPLAPLPNLVAPLPSGPPGGLVPIKPFKKDEKSLPIPIPKPILPPDSGDTGKPKVLPSFQ